MHDVIKVEGSPELVRDASSQAIINTNVEEYKNYIERRKLAAQRNDAINNQAKEIDSLKKEVGEIKSLLLELIRVTQDANTSKSSNDS